MRFIRGTLVAAALLATALAAMAPVHAQQTWPTRPVRFILPIGPGAGVDITARMLADKLAAK